MPEEVPSTPTQIPSILAIQKQLNYSDCTRQDRWQEFIDHIKKFARASIIRGGALGRRFDDWTSYQIQAALNRIANDYLDKHKNGERYWPREAKSPYFDASLKYSTNRHTIHSLVKQLFYRFIVSRNDRSSYMNTQRQQTRPEESRRQGYRRDPLESRGSTSEDAISLYSSSAPSSPRDCVPMSPRRGEHGSSATRAPETSQTGRSSQRNPQLHASDTQEDQDPYAVPLSSREGSVSNTCQNSPGSTKGASKPKKPAASTAKPTSKARKSSKTSSKSNQRKVTKKTAETASRRVRFARDSPGPPDPRSDSSEQIEGTTGSPTRELSPQTTQSTAANTKDRAESCIQVASEVANGSDQASTDPLEELLFPPSPGADDAPDSNENSAHGIERRKDSSSTDNTLVEGATATSESDGSSSRAVRQMIPDQSNTQTQYGVFAVPQEAADAYVSTGAHNGDVPIPDQFIQLKPDDTEAQGFVPMATMADGLVPMQVEYTANPQQEAHGMLRTATHTAEPNIGMSFILILARAPLFKSAEWKPRGKFLTKSFAQLQAELPQELQEGAQGLLFRLSGNGVDTEQPVHFGRDGQFDVLKRFFKRQIQSARARNRGANMLPFEIEIEALVEDVTRGEVDEDDDLF